MSAVANALVVVSEVVLSAYPLLIKLVDASIFFQTGLRMVVYTVLAALAAQATGNPLLATTLFSTESIATGLLNILHVVSSYTAFEKLAAGNAMALFYTYPVWNILGSAFLFGETFNVASIPWIGIALAGAIAVAHPTSTDWNILGVTMALVAALTETCIYLWFKNRAADETDERGPWTKMIQMYGSSSVIWTLGAIVLATLGFLSANTFAVSSSGLAGILLFNSLIGFVGYALRFYLIPKVNTVVFSSLSFLGVLSAYGFGWLGANEVPSLIQMAGALAIIFANTVLLSKETV